MSAGENKHTPSADELMENPDYLRATDELMKDSLKDGMDVLQLENGDLVVSGTKVIVNQYRWDDEKTKMVKLTEKQRQAEEKQREKENKRF